MFFLQTSYGHDIFTSVKKIQFSVDTIGTKLKSFVGNHYKLFNDEPYFEYEPMISYQYISHPLKVKYYIIIIYSLEYNGREPNLTISFHYNTTTGNNNTILYSGALCNAIQSKITSKLY